MFYLVLRALDTVEDDTKYPEDKKVPLLLEFHERMQNRGFTVTDCMCGVSVYICIDIYLFLYNY